jgi:hypothetical protein
MVRGDGRGRGLDRRDVNLVVRLAGAEVIQDRICLQFGAQRLVDIRERDGDARSLAPFRERRAIAGIPGGALSTRPWLPVRLPLKRRLSLQRQRLDLADTEATDLGAA